MYGLSLLDIIVIILYFLAMIGIGIWSSRRIKNREDFFLAGRRFGKLIQTFAGFGQATSSDAPVTATVLVARNGVAGIWTAMSHVITLPVYWITSVWYRRMRVLTLADFFEERYQSKSISIFYSILSSVFFVILLAVGFSAMTNTVTGMMIKPEAKLSVQERTEYQLSQELERLERHDYSTLNQDEKNRIEEIRRINPRREFSYVNGKVLTWVTAIIVIIYSAMGGLEAAFLTDMLQGIFIIILSVLLLPFIYVKICGNYDVSGLSGILEVARSNLPQEAFEMLNSPTATDSKWYFILVFAFITVLNVAVQANQVTAIGAAKDEYTSRYGFTVGIYIKRVCTLIWGVTALLIMILYGNIVSNSDYLWGYACSDLLGMAGFGLIGLMIACLMAALMSTVSALMISGSGLFTINVIKPLCPSMNERQYVNIGRVAGVIIVVAAAQLSLMYQNFFDLFKITLTFNCMFAPIFWLGVKWRRSNRVASWSCITVSLLIFFVIPAFMSIFDSVRTNDYLAKTTQAVTINRTYVAKKMDVEKRSQEIKKWDEMSYQEKASISCPLPLEVGKKFVATYITPRKSIFWSQGLKVDDQGSSLGQGTLNLELVIIDFLGFKLDRNSYALNETIRFLVMIILPFTIFYIVAKFTKPLEKTILDRFYVKMKTPVIGNHQDDIREIELSYKNPQRFDLKKMFPGSNWEFEKLDKTDIKGITISIIGCLILIIILASVAILGKA